eukprot:Unigene4470_Nuclearia_a/m.13658 Unigene4470_Nuclearia_a/g.13658  ORF Unigene4470_Nuclearia_a/g.13658 Unigene4470_Nuclearia_a/m.13658 type:complete len:269 (-) Unigene4470_Nuclearia_a:103-909(-)
MTRVVLRSGNLLKDPSRLQRDTAKEIVASIEAVARQYADLADAPFNGPDAPLVLADREYPAHERPDEPTSTTVTVKLFLFDNLDIATLHAALAFCWETLGLQRIDMLILSVPLDDNLDNQEELLPQTFLTAALPIWRALEVQAAAGKIGRLGVCGMSKVQLEQFYHAVEIKPSVDHVNLESCCTLPKDLIAFSSAHKIELLTHNDKLDILPQATLAAALAKHGAAGGLLARIAARARPAWILRFSDMMPQRGITSNKSYAVGLAVHDE